MTTQDPTVQLATLHLALEEVKTQIYTKILPLCAHLAPQDTSEMAQSLELAASAIARHQGQWKLVAMPITKEAR